MAGDRHGKHNTTTISFRVNSYEKATIEERLKAYEPELPPNMEPMVYVNYFEKVNWEIQDARSYLIWIPKP